MLKGMSLWQFREWRAYADLEPFDETRADLRAASIVQTIVNMNRDRKRHPTPVKLSECVLRFGEEEQRKPAKTWQEMKQIGQTMAAAFNEPRDRKARRRPKPPPEQ